ncbi:MAG TPA: hypothetical protein VH877_04805 [Polyangia bacterium]|jgi:hypothetical protein|nr:hypothetical protein [Polyangia bacterium]
MIPFDQLSAALDNYNRRRQAATEAPPQRGATKTPAAVNSVPAWNQETPSWTDEGLDS